MTQQLPDEVLAQFDIRVIAFLGGRLNQHWLVESRGERWVLRRWAQPIEDVAYEVRLLREVAERGWPVARVVAGPIAAADAIWSLAPVLPGEPTTEKYSRTEQRQRGQLLARLHADLRELEHFGQRPGWRRAEAALADPSLDELLAQHERQHPDEGRALR